MIVFQASRQQRDRELQSQLNLRARTFLARRDDERGGPPANPSPETTGQVRHPRNGTFQSFQARSGEERIASEQ
jgi:hypothetical protein